MPHRTFNSNVPYWFSLWGFIGALGKQTIASFYPIPENIIIKHKCCCSVNVHKLNVKQNNQMFTTTSFRILAKARTFSNSFQGIKDVSVRDFKVCLLLVSTCWIPDFSIIFLTIDKQNIWQTKHILIGWLYILMDDTSFIGPVFSVLRLNEWCTTLFERRMR